MVGARGVRCKKIKKAFFIKISSSPNSLFPNVVIGDLFEYLLGSRRFPTKDSGMTVFSILV